ncbi:hypothetical protein [Massilia sp. TSP1-1-2]|uniref:hypothetical protein n=1 Tax=Massilia sp. TSP1-1-2 TaxID=2804649 RepID=UPI003CF1CDD6
MADWWQGAYFLETGHAAGAQSAAAWLAVDVDVNVDVNVNAGVNVDVDLGD